MAAVSGRWPWSMAVPRPFGLRQAGKVSRWWSRFRSRRRGRQEHYLYQGAREGPAATTELFMLLAGLCSIPVRRACGCCRRSRPDRSTDQFSREALRERMGVRLGLPGSRSRLRSHPGAAQCASGLFQERMEVQSRLPASRRRLRGGRCTCQRLPEDERARLSAASSALRVARRS